MFCSLCDTVLTQLKGVSLFAQPVMIRNNNSLTSVETFGDGGGVDEIPPTETAGDELVERADGYPTSL